MKRIVAMALSGVAAFGLVAAIANDRDDQKGWEFKAEKRFERLDADKDGAVSLEEYMAYRTELARKTFTKMSGDDDILTLAEIKTVYAERAAKKAQQKSGKE